MKKYNVKSLSELMDIEMNTNSIEQANDIFETLMINDSYYSGCLTDNYTGETYRYFIKEIDSDGIITTSWSVFN